MTRLMEQAIELLRTAPESEQDRLARLLLNELEELERWRGAPAVQSHSTEETALISGSVAAAVVALPREDFSDWMEQ